MTTRILISIMALGLATACRGDSTSATGGDGDETAGEDSGGEEGETGDGAEQLTKSTRAQLQWKRNLALEGDLVRALELSSSEVCSEFGRGSCTRDIHHIALGGDDPLTIGLYQPLPDTLASTPVVFDRVVLSACTRRAQLDRDEKAVVFKQLDLGNGVAPAPEDEAYTATIEALYKRFLSRMPDPEELATLEALTHGPNDEQISAYDFAVLACYTIGTTTEFLFF